jgi:hypothetical protein
MMKALLQAQAGSSSCQFLSRIDIDPRIDAMTMATQDRYTGLY